MRRVFLATINLVSVELVIGNRVKTLDACGYVTICNPLHFQFMQPAEIADLLKAERGVIHQPNGGGFCHDGFCHF